MGTLRESLYFHEQARANDYDFTRLAEVEEERCGLCWNRWPKSMMRENNGVRRCPDCYEERDIDRINEIRAHDNERISSRQTRPQISIAPLQPTAVPFIRSMTSVFGVRVIPINPLSLSRGGAAKQLLVLGGNFSSADTFTYSSGISDSVAPALTDTTRWTLTLAAAGGMTPGLWHVTYNNRTYRNILSVR